jgi:2-polyprenyl-3-methyl-5-hydroxy-6-metoxy-1,4-benzoquinol methylase
VTNEGVRDYFNRTAVKFSANYVHADDFDERRRVWSRYIDQALTHLGADPLCLDVGCGDGALSRMVAERGVRTIGIDQSNIMLALAKHRAEQARLSQTLEHVEGSVPFQRHLYDRFEGRVGLILCSSVLEYVEDYQRVLRQFHGLLERGGWLLVSVPNRESIYRFGERMRKRFALAGGSYLEYQRSQFVAEGFKSTLRGLGFEVLRDEYFALPLHRHSARFFGQRRSKWLATLYLVALRKTA